MFDTHPTIFKTYQQVVKIDLLKFYHKYGLELGGHILKVYTVTLHVSKFFPACSLGLARCFSYINTTCLIKRLPSEKITV